MGRKRNGIIAGTTALIIAIYAPEITTLILQITTLITKNSTLIMHRRKRLGGMGNLS